MTPTDGERDLAALCARLVRRLRDVAPEDKLAATATDYLNRKRYLNPLRIKPLAGTLTARLQQRCSDWGVYWRAPDAHGVVLTHEQALELLRDALGVEVEFKSAADTKGGRNGKA